MDNNTIIGILILLVIFLIIQNISIKKQNTQRTQKKHSGLYNFIDDTVNANYLNPGSQNRWIIATFILCIFSFAIYYKEYEKEIQCDHYETAYLVGGTEHEIREIPSNMKLYNYVELSYQYKYKGNTYIAKIRQGSGNVDQKIKILINEENPTEYIYGENTIKEMLALVFLASVIFFIICVIKRIKYKGPKDGVITRIRWR